jgi:hypothetical protein
MSYRSKRLMLLLKLGAGFWDEMGAILAANSRLSL